MLRQHNFGLFLTHPPYAAMPEGKIFGGASSKRWAESAPLAPSSGIIGASAKLALFWAHLPRPLLT